MRMPGGSKLSTGVMVLYADEESFTLMTPQGHMFAGWITFSAIEQDDETRRTGAGADARLRPDLRAGPDDGRPSPGGQVLEPAHSATWPHTSAIRRRLSTPRSSAWTRNANGRRWRNVWHSSAIRSTIYMLEAPVRGAQGLAHRRHAGA